MKTTWSGEGRKRRPPGACPLPGVRSLAPAVVTAIVWAAPLAAQERCEGVVLGDVGIAGLTCSGDCRMTFLRQGGSGSASGVGVGVSGESDGIWRYSTEPEIAAVRAGSAAEGKLRAGDRVVAVDGRLITTLEGSRRLHWSEPGEEITIQFRRDGRLREASLRVDARCIEDAERLRDRGGERIPGSGGVSEGGGVSGSERVSVRGRLDPEGDSTRRRLGMDGLLRRSQVDVARLGMAVGRLADQVAPKAHLGMSFVCDDCTIRTTEEGGVVWSFGAPVRVEAVTPGGPADLAGIRRGDRIREVGGHPIESREGGEAFGSMEPGEPVRLVISRPSGSFGSVTVVPEAIPERAERAGQAPGRGVRSVGVGGEGGHPGPIRFTGVLGESLVEVRGGAVTAVKDERNGTLVIYTSDNVIVIRVPDEG